MIKTSVGEMLKKIVPRCVNREGVATSSHQWNHGVALGLTVLRRSGAVLKGPPMPRCGMLPPPIQAHDPYGKRVHLLHDAPHGILTRRLRAHAPFHVLRGHKGGQEALGYVTTGKGGGGK